MAKIINIFIYPEAGADGIEQSSIEIEAGSGIVGDRYYNNKGTFSKNNSLSPKQEITFIESEKIIEFNQKNNCQLNYEQLRRNVITQNVRLNKLVGNKFAFGNQLFLGIELCQPCAYLAEKVNPKIIPALIGKAGLRAQILKSGRLYNTDQYNAL